MEVFRAGGLSRAAWRDRCNAQQTRNPLGKDCTMASIDNMKASNATYESFLGFAKWGTIAVVILVAVVVGLIA